VAAAIEADLLDGIILEIVIVIIDYLILLVATLPQLFLSNILSTISWIMDNEPADFLR